MKQQNNNSTNEMTSGELLVKSVKDLASRGYSEDKKKFAEYFRIKGAISEDYQLFANKLKISSKDNKFSDVKYIFTDERGECLYRFKELFVYVGILNQIKIIGQTFKERKQARNYLENIMECIITI